MSDDTDNPLHPSVKTIKARDIERRLFEFIEAKGARVMLAYIAQELEAQGQLSPLFNQWLVSRLAQIAEGESADEALGTKRKRGDRSAKWMEIRPILQEIASERVNSDCSVSEAATIVAERHHKEASVYQKLARKHDGYVHMCIKIMIGDYLP